MVYEAKEAPLPVALYECDCMQLELHPFDESLCTFTAVSSIYAHHILRKCRNVKKI